MAAMSGAGGDWSARLVALAQRIPRLWLRVFFTALAINGLVFFYELAQFPISDHDVGYMSGISYLSGGRTGRWFLPFWYMLAGFLQLPVYTQFLAFIFLVVTGMGLVLLWKPNAPFVPLLAGALTASCFPQVTDFYYFHWQAHTFPAAELCMVLALHAAYTGRGATAGRLNGETACEKAGEEAAAAPAPLRWWRYALSTGLVVAGFASYQSAVMTWSVGFAGLVLMLVPEAPLTGARFRLLARRLAPPVGCLVLGAVLYRASLMLYPLVGLRLDLVQFQTLPISAMPMRCLEIVRQAILHFVTPGLFSPPFLTVLLAVLAASGAVVFLGDAWRRFAGHPHALGTWLFVLLCVLGLPVAAKSQFLVSAGEGWQTARFAAMGFNYVYLFFFLALVGSCRVMARNLGLVLGLLLVPVLAMQCLNAQVQFVRSNQHDFAVLNRVLDRIENLPGYDAAKTYHLVQLGRTRPYVPRGNVPATWSTRDNTVSQVWNPGFELWLLSSYLRLDKRLYEESADEAGILTAALEWAGGREPFPAKDSVGLVGDVIVLYFDKAARELLARRLGHQQ